MLAVATGSVLKAADNVVLINPILAVALASACAVADRADVNKPPSIEALSVITPVADSTVLINPTLAVACASACAVADRANIGKLTTNLPVGSIVPLALRVVPRKPRLAFARMLSAVAVAENPNSGAVNAAFAPLKAVKVELIKPKLAVMRSSTVAAPDNVEEKSGKSADIVSINVPVLDSSVATKSPLKLAPAKASSVVVTKPASSVLGASACIVAEIVGMAKLSAAVQMTLYSVADDGETDTLDWPV